MPSTTAVLVALGVSLAAVSANFCADERNAARDFQSATEEACKALFAFEQCISELDDEAWVTERTQELQEMQMVLQGCKTFSPQAKIRTSRGGGMTFAASEFNFDLWRTRRETINLAELKSDIDGFQDLLADFNASMLEAQSATVEEVDQTVGRFDATVKAYEGTVDDILVRVGKLETAGSACIPYVEFEEADKSCSKLTECRTPNRGGEYESVAPTRTSDRKCKAVTACEYGKFESSSADKYHDTVCQKRTECKASQFQIAGGRTEDDYCGEYTVCEKYELELVAATASRDRVCKVRTDCSRDEDNFKTVTIRANPTAKPVEVLCNNGKAFDPAVFGGDGSKKDNAGRSCYSIKRLHGKDSSGTYWIFGTKASDGPFETHCDMKSCGGDQTAADQGNAWQDKSLCGGWTLVAQYSRGSSCLNGGKTNRWRSKDTFGNTKTLANECGLGKAYTRNKFTDVMMGSVRSGQSARNVAWRHPTQYDTMYKVVQACERIRDGTLLVPGYKKPEDEQRQRATRQLDWTGNLNSYTSDGGCGSCCRGHYHDVCWKDNAGYWGFYLSDSSSNTVINGCNSIRTGHSGNIVGYGDQGQEKGHSRSYNCAWAYKSTNCLSSGGFGSGYGGRGGGLSDDTANFHYWGHGNSGNELYGQALFVRDSKEFD